MLARRGNDCPKAKRESGANGSRTRGFMLAPPYAQVTEMQGGGGGWFARGWSFAADGAMIFHAQAQRGFSRVVAPDSIRGPAAGTEDHTLELQPPIHTPHAASCWKTKQKANQKTP